MIMGMLGIAIARPQLLGILPSQTGTQIATFGGMVLFGAIVQWRMSRRAYMEGEETKIMPTEKEDVIRQIAA